MNVISKANLFDAAREMRNAQLLEKVARWYETATKNRIENLVELQMMFPSVDWVSARLVFNLGSYRLICGVSFERQALYFKTLMTHAEYDRGGWKS